MSPGEPLRYEVRLRSRRVRAELDSLLDADHRRVLLAMRNLADEPRPRGSRKLYDNVYRIRVGDWRVVYLIDGVNQRIEVGGVRRRSERTYRRLEDLFR